MFVDQQLRNSSYGPTIQIANSPPRICGFYITNNYTHTHKHTRTHTHTQTHTRTNTHAHKHTRAQTHTRTNTHAHTHTHTHTHTNTGAVGFDWTRNQPLTCAAANKTMTYTRNKHPCRYRYSNPQFQRLQTYTLGQRAIRTGITLYRTGWNLRLCMTERFNTKESA